MPRRMRPHRPHRSGFRRALWASAALHALAAGALVALLHFDRAPGRAPAPPGISTRAEPHVRVSLSDGEPAVEVRADPPAPGPPAPSAEPPPNLPRGPVAPNPPAALPPEVLALIRRPASERPAAPVGGAVTEVPAPPAGAPPMIDANVTPAGATGGAAPAGAPPIHGALRPNQTVVYVLDSSGSMGAGGKFDAARAQLVATLKRQPAGVRFQVIAYAGAPTPLLASDGTALPVTEAHVARAAQRLAALEPRGRSNHLAAIRAAVAFRPDAILVLTDAHDLTAAALKPLLAPVPHATVSVGLVTPDGVQPPRPVR